MNKRLITAERLKQCRLNAKETLEHIAQLTGVHKSTVLRWESGETDRIKITTISALASHYNVNPAWLLGANVPMEIENELPITENNNPTENDEVEEEYLLASRSKDGKRGIEILTKAEYETAKALIQTLRKNTNEDL